MSLASLYEHLVEKNFRSPLRVERHRLGITTVVKQLEPVSDREIPNHTPIQSSGAIIETAAENTLCCPRCGNTQKFKRQGNFHTETGTRQRFMCKCCNKSFALSRTAPIGNRGFIQGKFRHTKTITIINSVLSGFGVRETSRLLGVDPHTVSRIKKLIVLEIGEILCKCGKPTGHKGFCGFTIARSPNRIRWIVDHTKDISLLPVQQRPRYERKEIPNELETEIKLLVNSRFIKSLDAPVFDGDDCGHSVITTESKSPLELLILKEEKESQEYLEQQRRISEYQRYLERQASAFCIKTETKQSPGPVAPEK
jgi:transposase-like protein